MSNGIYVATAGAVAQSNALDATANNIANASTTAFRADRVAFRQALAAAQSPDIMMVGAGTSGVDVRGGELTQTGNPLDLALEGEGYFGVTTPQGPRYTRNGAFQLSPTGQLVTLDDLPVRGVGGAPIMVPATAGDLRISESGAVLADEVTVGQLELVRFDPTALQHEGGARYVATGRPLATSPETPLPTIRSGALEGSNVNIVRGVVDLVKVSRTYESLVRVIQSYHDVESRAARDLGAPR